MTGTFDVAVVGLGALGSATAWQLARRGHRVVGIEQFELGHDRGASHDTSRILRHSYHTPAYVRLAAEAYADWSDLEDASGLQLVTRTGGVDLFPPGAAIPPGDYRRSMSTCGIGFEELTAADVRDRWPVMRVPDGTVGLYQAETSIVPAALATATVQRLAEAAGAVLVDRSPVTGMRGTVDGDVVLTTPSATYTAARVVVTADAWTNEVVGHLGQHIPLQVLQEQVTYVRPPDPDAFAPGRFPVWIWMDDPSYYGFPCYGEQTVKSAQDCGGVPVDDPTARSRAPDPANLDRLIGFLGSFVPSLGGEQVRTKTCLYTLTPDRDFVLGPLPGHESVVVGLGAAHGFKFAPTFGRLLADLATGVVPTADLAGFAVDRPALVDPSHPVSWLV